MESRCGLLSLLGLRGRNPSDSRLHQMKPAPLAARHHRPATGGSRLLSERCATCILAAGDRMHLGPERLRAIIGDALAAGTFVVCHDTLTYGDFPGYGPAICRGFFDAYKDKSPALILLRAYQRLAEVPPPGSP